MSDSKITIDKDTLTVSGLLVAELGNKLNISTKEIQSLKQQLKEAEKCIEYYSDIDNFDYDYIRNNLEEHNEDGIYSRKMCTKARKYKEKYK